MESSEEKNWIKNYFRMWGGGNWGARPAPAPAPAGDHFSSATFREPIYKARVQNQSESWNKRKLAGACRKKNRKGDWLK